MGPQGSQETEGPQGHLDHQPLSVPGFQSQMLKEKTHSSPTHFMTSEGPLCLVHRVLPGQWVPQGPEGTWDLPGLPDKMVNLELQDSLAP